ncbi:MAG: hypothetical protein HZB53_17975 [Chloroflexi bacterium]|nr:hypothetical protein [Chloroflexota bacterium]
MIAPTNAGLPVSHRKIAELPFSVSHVADAHKRYPGEDVTFYARVDTHNPAAFKLHVSLPDGLEFVSQATVNAQPAGAWGDAMPQIGRIGGETYVTWEWVAPAAYTARIEVSVTARIMPAERPVVIDSTGYVTEAVEGGAERVAARDVATVHVATASRLIKYLPALYHDDDLMGRYLMIFESLLSPIEERIETMSYFFDPRVTPAHFLPWLATWADLQLDERWPVDSQRRLLRAIATLYRRRGTRAGLAQFLEIYSGFAPEITESRANNFRLGSGNRLGPTVAIGKGNAPQSFQVLLRLPPFDGPDAERREKERQRVIESIIVSEKPAHAHYSLEIVLDADATPAAADPGPIRPV